MLIVQKYGGTSVGTLERIKEVAKRIIKSKNEGNTLIIVVSAMSGVTNDLIKKSEFFSEMPNLREYDILLSAGERVTSSLLAIALNEMGHKAISFSGRKAGIYTDSFHSKAKIEYIDTTNIKNAINDGYIVVVAGFQGIDKNGEVTTLGRGGSDLSAVALAGAVNADLCEIYTDVNGVYTTDPRIEPKAKKIDKISYDEMLELAGLGAKVLQTRSVELAKKINVNLVTRNSFNEENGTLITGENNMEGAIISGIALDKNQARITIRGLKDEPGVAADIFEELAKENINVDMIIQNAVIDNSANLSFTIPENEIKIALKALKMHDPNLQIEANQDIVKVSIIGVGMKSHSGVASVAFKTLAHNKINISMISTSEIKISVIVDAKYGELAVRVLHEAYNLDKQC